MAAFLTPPYPTRYPDIPVIPAIAAEKAVITIGIVSADLTTTDSIDLLEVLQGQDDKDNAKYLYHNGAQNRRCTSFKG